jgi:class 3 adenylate cyclase
MTASHASGDAGIEGPGTSILFIRVGMHSGPVVVGVLRGDTSWFQLFGDA